MKHVLKKISILIIGVILMSFNLQNNEETYSLTITVKDLRNSKGVVQFAIYNKEGSIPDEKYKKYYKKDIVVIVKNTATITFNDLPKGRYAINILHDENENGKIDKKFILPKEGIGFSNYQSIGMRNRPKFSKASFEVNSNITKIIKIIYM
ncbi:MAG: DUF2141 domain-containing protein [Flavobacteriaceae bacterium]|nr:DUF2141 domain-containing protein [Flavobacteriaceae bacterium]